MAWYLNRSGSSTYEGPFEDDQIVGMLRIGELQQGYIARSGSPDWLPLTQHPPFAEAIANSAGPAAFDPMGGRALPGAPTAYAHPGQTPPPELSPTAYAQASAQETAPTAYVQVSPQELAPTAYANPVQASPLELAPTAYANPAFGIPSLSTSPHSSRAQEKRSGWVGHRGGRRARSLNGWSGECDISTDTNQ